MVYVLSFGFQYLPMIGWRKPNHGEGIVSTKHRPKSFNDFLLFSVLFHCFIMCFVVSGPFLCDIFHTRVARYGPFVLKVPLNTKQLTK